MSRSKERLVEEKRGLGEVVLEREESLTAVSGWEPLSRLPLAPVLPGWILRGCQQQISSSLTPSTP